MHLFIFYCSHPFPLQVFLMHQEIYFEHCSGSILLSFHSLFFELALLIDELLPINDFSYQLQLPYSSISTAKLIIAFFFRVITRFSSCFVCVKAIVSYHSLVGLSFFKVIVATYQILCILLFVLLSRTLSIFPSDSSYKCDWLLLDNQIC